MISELDKVLTYESGIACIDCDSVLSSLFLQLHFIDNFIKKNGNVILVSTHLSLNTLKIICGKMAIKIDTNLIHVLPTKDLLSNCLINDVQIFDRIEKKINNYIKIEKNNLIIFDDFDSLLCLAVGKSFTIGLQFLQRLRLKLSDFSLILIECSNKDLLSLDVFNLLFRLKPIGSGFDKNLTGELEICQKNKFYDLYDTKLVFHYLVNERSTKLFYPGSAQFFM